MKNRLTKHFIDCPIKNNSLSRLHGSIVLYDKLTKTAYMVDKKENCSFEIDDKWLKPFHAYNANHEGLHCFCLKHKY